MIILASVPLMTLAFAVVHGQECLSARGIAGGVLTIVAIAVLSVRAMGDDVAPIYFVSALLGAVAAAESSVIAKSLPSLDPLMGCRARRTPSRPMTMSTAESTGFPPWGRRE